MYDTAVTIKQAEITCDECGERLLARHFMDTVGGDQHTTCRKCRNAKLPVPVSVGVNVKELAKRMAASAKGKHIDSPHITELNAEMYALFGGVKGMARAWYDQIQIAVVERPGSKTTLDQFAELARLAKFSTEHRSSAPDVATLTDQELGEEMLKLAMDLIPKLEEEQRNGA